MNYLKNVNMIKTKKDKKYCDSLKRVFCSGLTYSGSASKFGIKLGILNGNANQSLENIHSHSYVHNKPDISPTWVLNMNDYRAIQNGNNSGNLYFGGFDFSHPINEEMKLVDYFNYLKGNIDFQNSLVLKCFENFNPVF